MNKYELKRLIELQEYNYCNSGIICDVALADEIKYLIELEGGNQEYGCMS